MNESVMKFLDQYGWPVALLAATVVYWVWQWLKRPRKDWKD